MTAGDRWVIVGLLLLSLAPWAERLRSGNRLASDTDSYMILTYDSGESRRISGIPRAPLRIRGRIGESVVEWRADGAFRFLASPCPNRVCIGEGWASPGAARCCLPNGVAVTWAGGRGGGGWTAGDEGASGAIALAVDGECR